MASSLYRQCFVDGTSELRRRAKQGRKPQGLGKSFLVRLDRESESAMDKLAEYYGEYWNRSEFIRAAVRNQLYNSVYAELLNT